MNHDGDHPTRGQQDFPGRIAELASESIPAWPRRPRAHAGAPNIVVVLLDDLGFSDISPFGAEIDTPALEELAASGYRLANYQTPPMCAPARAALMTGLNPHRAGFSFVPHIDPGFPHARMELPHDAPTLAETLRGAGYATFMVGKWHLTPEAQMHDGADRSSWPCQRGFDRFYGCLDGFTSLFHPHRLLQDNTPMDRESYPEGYHLTDDLTDRALDMIGGLRASDPDKPFLLYFSHIAVHAPLQAKPEDIAKYRGMYDSGWDHVRSERFAREVRNGLFPEGTRPAGRNSEPGLDVVPWDSLDDGQRLLFSRYMEVYAAAVDNVDQNLRRLTDRLKELGEYENTIILFTSDNGASGEGGETGTRSYFSRFVTVGQELPPEWQADVPRNPELIGGPQSFAHYPRGWAYASNTPFRLYKTHPYSGGVRVPMLVSWPAGLPRTSTDGGVRQQFAYATDVMPTLLDLAGVEPLQRCAGGPAQTPDGRSFAPWLRTARARSERGSQYVELNGRRSFHEGGWKVVAPTANGPGWSPHGWELYHVEEDPAETRNLAATHPERVRALGDRWRATAWANQVFPLNDDGSLFRRRPSTELVLEQPVTLFPGTPTLERYRSSKLVALRSTVIDVQLDYRSGDEGVLVAHGDQGGGYLLYVEDGAVHCAYNEYGRMRRVSAALPVGTTEVGLRFEVLPQLRWRLALSVDGTEEAALGSVVQLVGMCPLTGISVGADRGGPVDWDLYQRRGPFRYQGNLRHVRYTPGTKADYHDEELVDIEQQTALQFD
ncbi:arylsulfatase [Arthrobacter crystallopoietes]|uniref:arylsulfatase n=1 Tax=Crystallibacter crystallopoietes TaxID=37928 RepID=UPI001ABE36E8|nr:arylsulfatase [Arthrobacter crystallopoietes]QTG82094.1 arylsulfatase [Arthrobacter crystallopoietes]